MQQRDQEWFKQRAGKLTGSRFNALMARTKSGPSAMRTNLISQLAVERIIGNCVETYTNAAMARGVELEPEARFSYEAETGDVVDEIAFIPHERFEFVGVSPDGMVGDNGMVEIKCPSAYDKHVQALLKGAHAKEYRWQIQGQMWVADREWCDAVSYDPRFPDHLQLAVARVERDDDAIRQLEKECIKANEEIDALVDQMNQLEKASA